MRLPSVKIGPRTFLTPLSPAECEQRVLLLPDDPAWTQQLGAPLVSQPIAGGFTLAIGKEFAYLVRSQKGFWIATLKFVPETHGTRVMAWFGVRRAALLYLLLALIWSGIGLVFLLLDRQGIAEGTTFRNATDDVAVPFLVFPFPFALYMIGANLVREHRRNTLGTVIASAFEAVEQPR